MTFALHACACTPTKPCTYAAVLFRARKDAALTKHLERLLERAAAEATLTDKVKHLKVPLATAKTWRKETVPLRAFLQEAPRDWPALRAWADLRRIPEYRLHNQVAWLEGEKLARATMIGERGRADRQLAIWRAV
jgi:hypothetical protein